MRQRLGQGGGASDWLLKLWEARVSDRTSKRHSTHDNRQDAALEIGHG